MGVTLESEESYADRSKRLREFDKRRIREAAIKGMKRRKRNRRERENRRKGRQ